ncbi:MAG: hypothetical protein Q9187_008168, partial [Circinaria calcarea]
MPGPTSNITIPIPGSFTAKLEIAKAKELASERSKLKTQKKALGFRPSELTVKNVSALQVSSAGHGVGELKGFSLDIQSGLDEKGKGTSMGHEKPEDLGYQKADLPAVKNRYAGLISAKKRKRGGHERAAISSPMAESGLDPVPASVNAREGHVAGKRPFAPAKKPARRHRPTYGNL